jgi:tRNA A-37 threonylcarbamoyl transferase component Bud32
MQGTRNCPRCHASIAPDAPEALCPRCLMAGGFVATAGAAATTGAAVAAIGDFVPPPLDEMARRFPQLEVLEFIGRGGMSAVYKARQPNLDRVVALKILPASLNAVPGFAERFAREAQALAKLTHPNIVAVHDFGQSDGLFYFIMEYVDGPNLRQVIRSGKLAPAQVLAIIPKICEALQYAHDHGVVHRDIKPENILVGGRGQVKIADFGLAKLLGRALPEPTLTATGQVMGTPQYMAPEQVEHPREVDHRADIYSLGVVFYELLTGELPIGRFSPPSAKVHVDVCLDEVVLKALEKEPERRYQNASELKHRVEDCAGHTPRAAAAAAAPVEARTSVGAGAWSGEAPRLCTLPVWGGVWAIFGFAAILAFMTVSHVSSGSGQPPEPSLGEKIFQYAAFAVAMIGLGAPVGSTVLGCMGIGRIRASAGRLYGMLLAVAVALVFPILVADGFLIYIFDAIRGNAYTDFWKAAFLVWILIVIALDALAIRAVWRAAHRTV